MAGKRIETRLTIKAVDQYSATLKRLGNVTGRFADKVRADMAGMQNMRGPLKLIQDFKRQSDVVARSGQAVDAAREKQRQLLATIKATKTPTAAMRREFEAARRATEKLEERHAQHRRTLSGLHGQLRQAGVNTVDLAGEERRLAAALDRANGQMDRQAEKLERLATMQERIGRARERMDKQLATAGNLTIAGYAAMQTGRRIVRGLAGPVQAAIEFESAMSDVRKVVDFDSPEAFKAMSDDILELSTRIPMAAEGLAQIVAAGGQSGIPREELSKFAEMAAKVGVAFDISADQAGTSMAKIKTALGLSLDETGALFDAMNHLSNNSAAVAADTAEFINRAGADGQRFGFDPTETLAIGAAMIAAGAGADTAATSFRNMGRALTKGNSATGRQSAAFEALGLNAADVAMAMQSDAVGTTMDVLDRLAALPDHLKASTMSDLFGDEARELGKLLNNMDLMPDALRLVSDETDYLGSAEAEYAERSKTTANNIQLMRNQLSRLGITIGEVVLPPLNDFLGRLQGVVDKVVAWAKAHPKLTKYLVMGTAAVGGLAIAAGGLLTAAGGLIGTLAVMRFGLSVLGARAAFAAGSLGGLGRAVPNFGRARGAFTGFGNLVGTTMAGADAAVASATAAMNRNLAKIKWKAAFAAIQMATLASKIPTDPAEREAWQDQNVRDMDEGLRSAPIIGPMMRGYDRLFESVHGKPAPVAAATDTAGMSAERAAAVSLLEGNRNGTLPTPSRLASLREEAAGLRDDIATIKADIEAIGTGPAANPHASGGIFDRLEREAKADELAEVEAELAKVEGQLADAEAQAGELGAALQLLSGTEVAPEISTESIDRALEKVRALNAQLRAVPGAAAGTPGSGQKPQERATGGSYRPGWRIVGERGPELEYMNRSGYIAHHGKLRAMARAASVAGSAGLAAAAPAAAGTGAVTVHVNGGIHVTAPSGVSDPAGLAAEIERALGDRLGATLRASFTD